MRAISRAPIWALVAVLAACAPAPDAPPRRDADTRISSAVLFDPARFAGRWRVATSHTPGCTGAVQDWAAVAGGGYALSGIDCTGPAPAALGGRAIVTGPGGRITPEAGFGRDPVWVLWVDEGYRIAALGTPSGAWAMILVREGAARADLIAAAREVLAFNGYDLAQLAP